MKNKNTTRLRAPKFTKKKEIPIKNTRKLHGSGIP